MTSDAAATASSDAPTQASDETRRDNRLMKRLAALLALALALLLLFFLWPRGEKGPSLRELLVQSRDAYHAPWESVEDAATTLGTVEAALAFVSDEIATSIYEGRLQSPLTVLETRVANPADKAMLLQALLAALEVPTDAFAAPMQGSPRTALLAQAYPAESAWSEPMVALMERIGYDEDQHAVDATGDLLVALSVFEEHDAVVGAALDHAETLLSLDGRSTAASASLDWVWLQDADGTIYDPVLPDEDRSDLARAYDVSVEPVGLTITSRDRLGRVRTVMDWSGEGFGRELSLAFFPTVGTMDRLIGDADLSDVEVWTPSLLVGGELQSDAAVTLDGDVVPPSIARTLTASEEDTNDVDGFVAPDVAELSISDVQADGFPRVSVGLRASVQNAPNWHAGHFRVLVDGVPAAVRIDEPFAPGSDVVVVHDQTGSMGEDNRFELARSFGRSLAGGLSVGQRVALLTINNHFLVERLFDPVQAIADIADPVLWEQRSVRGQFDVLDAIDNALNVIEIDLGPSPETITSVVVLSDGAPSATVTDAMLTEMDDLIERAQSLNARVVPVLFAASSALPFDRLAEETGGRLVQLTDPARIGAEAARLARELAGGMLISFEAPLDPVPEGGTELPFTLELAGYDGIEASGFMVPSDVVASQPGLFLEIRAGGLSSVRPLMALGDAYDVNTMTGRYQLHLAPGRYPADRVVAQKLDAWIGFHDLAVGDREAYLAGLQPSGLSADDVMIPNGLANIMLSSVSDDQRLRYPLAILDREVVDETAETPDGSVAVARTMDVPAWSTLLADQADRQAVARLGLALNDAEARQLENALNLTALFPDAASASTDDAATLWLARADREDVAWQHQPTEGGLYGYVFDGELAAKGSRDVQIAQEFARINSAIDMYMVAAGPGVGMTPMSTVLSGFIGFKKAELKLWCHSTIMLNYVNEVISGDPETPLAVSAEAADARARELCGLRGDPRDIGREMFEDAAFAMGSAVVDEIRKGGLPGIFGGTNDVVSAVNSALGGDNVTSFVSDSTTRNYVDQVLAGWRGTRSESVESVVDRPFNQVMDALRRRGLAPNSSPTTSGFDSSLQTAIFDLPQIN
ncbi:MAG: vWA domain-containing protein [Pseudomonadota bacterium]